MVNEKVNKNKAVIKLATKSKNVSYFMPMLQCFEKRDDLNEVIKNRVVKSCDLLDAGVKLYPNDFVKNNAAASIVELYGEYDVDDLLKLDEEFSLAGRMVLLRSFGKVSFFDLMDYSGRIQCYVSRASLSEEQHQIFKKLAVGDIIGVKGKLFKTKTGELTIDCCFLELLTRAMRSLPEKYHGLKDLELRYRQRYVDLIVTPRTRDIFQKRSMVIRECRRFLEDNGFLEVETPMMQSIAGGATARPFITHHNALDLQLYMRVAPELYLKRLLVGGFEKIFEINRNFRNEGVSTRHNPEFTMCEFYWAYATYEDLMCFTEKLFSYIALKVCGTTKIVYQENEIDLTVGKWNKMAFYESLEIIGGHSADFYNNYNDVKSYIQDRGEKVAITESLVKMQTRLFDIDVEPKLIQPYFIYHYPIEISPLSRRNEENPELADRYELFMCGREMANAFSELNDPIDQRVRLEDQMRAKEAGDEDVHVMDEDFLRALEYGMPPAAGQGIGIDRLVMLLTDSASIREVILFPLLKPEI